VRRARNLGLTVLGIGVLVGLLGLGGCFDSKIDSFRAAAILKAEGGRTWKKVTCRPFAGPGGYWDYTCRVESREAAPFSFDIRVTRSGIAEQTAP
jgi:hypothetical protein